MGDATMTTMKDEYVCVDDIAVDYFAAGHRRHIIAAMPDDGQNVAASANTVSDFIMAVTSLMISISTKRPLGEAEKAMRWRARQTTRAIVHGNIDFAWLTIMARRGL